MLYEAIAVALVVFLTVGGQELLGFTMLGRPIVIAPLVGLLLGDLQTGLLVGAALETIFMGWLISVVQQLQNQDLPQPLRQPLLLNLVVERNMPLRLPCH